MNLKSLFIPLFLCFISAVSFAQDLVLIHEKKQRKIEAGRYLTVEVRAVLSSDDCPKCFDRIVGKLVGHDTSSLQIRVTRKDMQLEKDCKSIGGQTIHYTKLTEAPVQSILKSDIMSIVVGGKNKEMDMPLGDGIALALGVVGFGHLISAPLGDGNAGLLAALGATEIVVSALLGTFSTEKSFLLQSRGPSDEDKKLWNMQ